MLIIDGVKYKLWMPEDEEEEFHPIVKEHSKEIFGEHTVYFDIGMKLKSVAGLGAKPDGCVIHLEKNEWDIVEIELSKHNPYDHIVNQLTRFINAIENPKTRNYVVDILYDEIDSHKLLRAYVEEGVRGDIHHWLSKLISQTPKIVVIIEEKTEEVVLACNILMKNFKTQILELKTFIREDAPSVHAHLFEPLYSFEKIAEKGVKEKKEEGKRPLPEHYESWEKMLSWVDENTKDLVKVLTDNIINLGEVTHMPHGRYYCFYKGKPRSKSIFVAFLLTKKALKVRIRTDPKTFKDFRKWTGDRIYRGWFFKQGEEREFKITNKEQKDYAMELIKHSYQISGEGFSLAEAFR